MTFREKLSATGTVFTGEVAPPKGVNCDKLCREVEDFRGHVAAINVTDLQSAVLRASSLPVCIKIRDMGVEPILQVTCRDRNRLAIQADLLGAAMSGIENVLCLTGDHILRGDQPQAKPVHDLDSITLLGCIDKMMNGEDISGNKLDSAPDFFAGAVVSPCAEPLEPQIIKLEKKVAAGAKFIQTQAVYDPAKFERFMKEVSHLNVPILCGILLLKSERMARFMNANTAGIAVPENLIAKIAAAKKGDEKKVSVDIAASLMRDMRGMCKGFHLMPLGWSKQAVEAIQASS